MTDTIFTITPASVVCLMVFPTKRYLIIEEWGAFEVWSELDIIT